MKKILIIIASSFMIFSCTTMKSPTDMIPMDDLELYPGVEMEGMIMPLYRDTYTTSETENVPSSDYSSTGSTTTETTTTTHTNNLHPLGVYIGNDLFIDLNGNVSLVLSDLFDLRNRESWEVECKPFGSLQKTDIIKDNNSVVSTTKGLFGVNKVVLNITEDSLHRSSVLMDETVIIDDGEYSYSTSFGFLIGSAYVRELEYGVVDFDGREALLGDNEIVIEEKRGSFFNPFSKDIAGIRVINNNGLIEVYQTVTKFLFFKGEELVATIAKNPEGLIVKTPSFFGASVKTYRIDGDNISVKSGFTEFYYTLK